MTDQEYDDVTDRMRELMRPPNWPAEQPWPVRLVGLDERPAALQTSSGCWQLVPLEKPEQPERGAV